MFEDNLKRIVSFVLTALLLGLPGCGLAFGDLTRDRTILDWSVLGAAYYLLAGFLLGVMEWRFWYLAGLVAWGPITISALLLFFNFDQQLFSLATILVPLMLSMAGSLAGALLRSRIGAESPADSEKLNEK
jgi:hypothetical protein